MAGGRPPAKIKDKGLRTALGINTTQAVRKANQGRIAALTPPGTKKKRS